MRALTILFAAALCSSLLAACSDHVVVDKGDGGTSGPDDCSRFCHYFDGTSCGSTLDVSKCVSSCTESLSTCSVETRAFLDCSLKPGVLACTGGMPSFAGCESAASALAVCDSKHPGSGGGGGSTGSGSSASGGGG
jgi:hypothetical protein